MTMTEEEQHRTEYINHFEKILIAESAVSTLKVIRGSHNRQMLITDVDRHDRTDILIQT